MTPDIKINLFAPNKVIPRPDKDAGSRNLNGVEAKQLVDNLFPSLNSFSSQNITGVKTNFQFKQIKNETQLGTVQVQHTDMGELIVDISARINSKNEIKLILQPKLDSKGFDVKFNNKALKRTEALKDITRLIFEKLEASIAYSNDSQLENDGNILNNSNDALERLNSSPFSILAKEHIQRDALEKAGVPHRGAYTVENEDGSIEIQRYDQPFSIRFENSDQTRTISQQDFNQLLEKLIRARAYK